jgi:hypothetical protein
MVESIRCSRRKPLKSCCDISNSHASTRSLYTNLFSPLHLHSISTTITAPSPKPFPPSTQPALGNEQPRAHTVHDTATSSSDDSHDLASEKHTLPLRPTLRPYLPPAARRRSPSYKPNQTPRATHITSPARAQPSPSSRPSVYGTLLSRVLHHSHYHAHRSVVDRLGGDVGSYPGCGLAPGARPRLIGRVFCCSPRTRL